MNTKKSSKIKSKNTPVEPSSAVYRAGVRRLNKCIEILERYSGNVKDDKKWPVEYLKELSVYLEFLQKQKYKVELKKKREERKREKEISK